MALNHSNTDFFIDVINCLSNHLYIISDIINNSSLENSLSIKEIIIYEGGILSSYFFRNEAAMSYFSLSLVFLLIMKIKTLIIMRNIMELNFYLNTNI